MIGSISERAMIQQLHVQDYAVIDKVSIELAPGLNILTGETGAGKSVVVEALNMVLGERADPEVVRSGCDRSLVEVVLDVSRLGGDALDVLATAGFTPDEGRIVVSRELQRGGKSQCRINGRPATVSLLKRITDSLVDVHGQHDHQSLLKVECHLDILDAWCGEEVLSLRAQVAEGFERLRGLERELGRLQSDQQERARTVDLYRFQIEEIASARLQPGEEEGLLAERARLANAEKLHAAASAAFEALGDRTQELCALDKLGDAADALRGLAQLDPHLQPMTESIQSAFYQAEDAARELRAYRDGVEFNPERLESIEERLDLLRTLKRKYGETIESILEYAQDLERQLDALTHSEERSAELSTEIERVQSEVAELAGRLSDLRRKGGTAFGRRIVKELESLSMADAMFEVAQEVQELDASGIDRVEFLISANPGEPVKSLAKIASGGEMSRVMLAIKSVMASVDSLPVLVFDEIDVGIGGRTADVIGEKLELLSGNSQVLCITHLPQIASRSADHFYVEKELSDGRTVVKVRQLTDEERVAELARMLGGAEPSDTAVTHAREMLARKAKDNG